MERGGKGWRSSGSSHGAQATAGQVVLARETLKKAGERYRLREEDRTRQGQCTVLTTPRLDLIRDLAMIQGMAGGARSRRRDREVDPRCPLEKPGTGDGRQEPGRRGTRWRHFADRGLESADDRRMALEYLAEGLSDRLHLEQIANRRKSPIGGREASWPSACHSPPSCPFMARTSTRLSKNVAPPPMSERADEVVLLTFDLPGESLFQYMRG